MGFNPRAPCGARHIIGRVKELRMHVSIHAPRVGRDLSGVLSILGLMMFQSTRPVWGATATGVTTSPFCHVFMGIPLHKYDFLGT